jgi:hypothetical protein
VFDYHCDHCDQYLHDCSSLSIIPLSTTTTTTIIVTIYFEVSKTYRPAISPLCILS